MYVYPFVPFVKDPTNDGVQWGTKSYELDSPAPAIPKTIADLSTSIIRSIPWTNLTPSSSEWKDYKAEGGQFLSLFPNRLTSR